jgi:hypothetical protein
MANPGVGQFAGAFANAFFQAKNNKRQNERDDKIAKLQMQLVDAQIKAGNVKLDAQTTLSDIMMGRTVGVEPPGSENPGMFGGTRKQLEFGNVDESGLGTFSKTGPEVAAPEKPLSVAEMMAGGSSRALQGQQAGIASGAFTGGDIADFQLSREKTKAGQDFDTMMATMTDATGKPMYIAGSFSTNPFTGAQTVQWIRNPDVTTPTDVAKTAEGMDTLVRDAFEIADITNETPPLLQSGVPGNKNVRNATSFFGAVQNQFGIGDQGAEEGQDSANFDRKEKLYGVITQYNVERFGANTDQGRAMVMAISPSLDKKDEANALLIADHLQSRLSDAVIDGVEIPEKTRNEYIRYIKAARDGSLFNGSEDPANNVPANEPTVQPSSRFANFTSETLGQINLDDIVTPEDIASLELRIAELKSQTSEAAGTGVDRARSGLATARDLAQMQFDDISQITLEDTKKWTADQKAALEKRWQQMGRSALAEKAKAGFATASDFAMMTFEEISQITPEDIQNWSAAQKEAYERKRKQLLKQLGQ